MYEAVGDGEVVGVALCGGGVGKTVLVEPVKKNPADDCNGVKDIASSNDNADISSTRVEFNLSYEEGISCSAPSLKVVDTTVPGGRVPDRFLLKHAIALNNTIGWYTRVPMSLINFIVFDALMMYHFELVPLASMWSLLAVYYIGVAMIGGIMSVMLHRFFSHGAFSASRGVTFCMALVSCLALQRGPIWWASKHIRHHANCDTDDDPHSPVKAGALYCIFFSSFDCDVDWKYVPKRLLYPELIVLDALHFVPPVLLLGAIYKLSGEFYAAFFVALPMTWCVLMTNVFNWRFHDEEDSLMHSDKSGECKAVDRRTELMANLVGENLHMQHHLYPRQAQRHSSDLPYWVVIRPLLMLGVISHPKYDGLNGSKEVRFSLSEFNVLGALKTSIIEILVIGATLICIVRCAAHALA